jgi:hypothetical protein
MTAGTPRRNNFSLYFNLEARRDVVRKVSGMQTYPIKVWKKAS